MPARVEQEPQPQIEQPARTFGQVFQQAYERIGPAVPGVVVRGIQNVSNMTLNTLDAVVTTAARIIESPGRYAINHPDSAAVGAAAATLGVFGLAACAPPPSEPPRPGEVQPADTGATATAIANSPNASESILPDTRKNASTVPTPNQPQPPHPKYKKNNN